MPPHPHRADRHAAWITFIITFTAYSYFFQGIGWNQMAHFATIRSLVENGTAEISRFTDLTQDIMVVGDRTYSNKPPGIALLGIPPYFILMSFESWFGIDFNWPTVWLNNLHVMTALLSALPGALLNVQLFFAFRREQASIRTAMLLAGAFAFGSLSWPYSGLLMSHLACASLVFAAWYFATQPTLTWKDSLAAGALLGVGILCDVLVAPVAVVLGIYLIARKTSPRHWLLFIAGPCAGVLLTMLYNRLAQNASLQSGPFHPTANFSAPGLFLGEFSWPQWSRIYWITYQPMRGIFACCPMFMICALGLFLIRRPLRGALDRIAILLILAIYIFFYLTFIGWTGGWSVGLRYMIPALALCWMFALKPFLQFPKISAILIALSIFNMLAVTSVLVLYPGPGSGKPDHSDPVRGDQIVFLQGHTNRTQLGHNIASLLGVPEKLQLIPIYLLLIAFYTYAFTRPKSNPHPIKSRA